jgi:hypothetical protein
MTLVQNALTLVPKAQVKYFLDFYVNSALGAYPISFLHKHGETEYRVETFREPFKGSLREIEFDDKSGFSGKFTINYNTNFLLRDIHDPEGKTKLEIVSFDVKLCLILVYC